MQSRLSLMRDQILHVGARESVREHRTPAYKLVVGIDADVIVRHRGRTFRAAALLMPPREAHALEVPGVGVGLFWALGSPGVPWTPSAAGPVVLNGKTSAALRAWAKQVAITPGKQDPGCDKEALRLLRLPKTFRIDGRVEGTLRRLAANPLASLQELAASARLSPERLRHLIVGATGVPLREYRLLQKTTVALEHALSGASWTSAALSAGFSDQAHLTRTFVRFFGRTPSSRPSQAWLHDSWAPRDSDQSEACPFGAATSRGPSSFASGSQPACLRSALDRRRAALLPRCAAVVDSPCTVKRRLFRPRSHEPREVVE